MLNGLERSCTSVCPAGNPICQLSRGARSIRIETKTQASNSHAPLSKIKNRISWARIRYNSFTVAVVYNSPGIAEQLSQLCRVVVAVLGFLSRWFIVAQPQLASRTSAMRQCTQLNGKTIRKEFYDFFFFLSSHSGGKVIGVINNEF